MAPSSDRRNIEITKELEKQPGHHRPPADKGDKEMSSISIQTMHTPIPATLLRQAGTRAAFNLAAAVAKAFHAWRQRAGAPSRLYGLSDYVLNDIGLSRGEIGQGPAESFWRV
jgi:uncharacterized protein YjiS (DUF1127 family)